MSFSCALGQVTRALHCGPSPKMEFTAAISRGGGEDTSVWLSVHYRSFLVCLLSFFFFLNLKICKTFRAIASFLTLSRNHRGESGHLESQ